MVSVCFPSNPSGAQLLMKTLSDAQLHSGVVTVNFQTPWARFGGMVSLMVLGVVSATAGTTTVVCPLRLRLAVKPVRF